MCPKTGEFTCPEPGLYLILATCCTFDMKKCLVSIRKNGKDAANIFDQDGDQNKVRTRGWPSASKIEAKIMKEFEPNLDHLGGKWGRKSR